MRVRLKPDLQSGEGEAKLSAVSQPRLGPDPSAMTLDDAADGREADARALELVLDRKSVV